MYAKGRGVAQDAAEAARWYRKAATANDPDAQEALAAAYFTGEGVAQDYVQAYKWYKFAEANYPFARTQKRVIVMSKIRVLEAKMTAAQLAEAKRLVRNSKP
jgi:hypothetical protein